AEGGRIALPQPAGQGNRIESRRIEETLREIGLEDVAREDPFDGAFDGADVSVARKVAGEALEAGSGELRGERAHCERGRRSRDSRRSRRGEPPARKFQTLPRALFA